MRAGFFLAFVFFSQVAFAQVATERGVVYRNVNGRSLVLDVYRPRAAGPHPAIMLIHGGSWDSGDRRDLGPAARELAERGFVAFAIEYRLSGEARFPAAVEDARAAIRWIGRHAPRFGADPARLGVFGPSAGGYLALMTAALEPRIVRACVAWSAPTDFVRGLTEGDAVPRGSLEKVEKFLGARFAANPRRYAVASPATHVTPAMAPLLLVHGDRDRVSPFGQAQYMLEAATARGVDVDLVRVRGAGHALDRRLDVRERTAAFFAERL